ncbi:MAG: hypothetical protein U0Q07_18055 [Acidimicrobiales bacterium]
MASLPIPFLSDLQLPIPGRNRTPARATAVDADDDPAGELVADGPDHDHTDNRVIVGGRHGSPSIVVGLPLADITVQERDPTTTAAVTELAGLVAALAEQVARLVPADGPASPTAGPDGDHDPDDGEGTDARPPADATAATPAVGVDPVIVEEVRSRALALQRTLLSAG